jgi:hypothetical protein
VNTYYFNLKSTRQGPFIAQTDDGPEKVVARAKSVYGIDLQDMQLETKGGEKITIYTSEEGQ